MNEYICGTLTAEQVRKAIFNSSSYASYDGVKYYADGINMQVIADELNTRAEWTCKIVVKDNMNESEGMGDVWIECSACHCQFDYYADNWLMMMNYCPNCGARVLPT